MAFKGIISRREGAVRFDLYALAAPLFGDCGRCTESGPLPAIVDRRRGPRGTTVVEQRTALCGACMRAAEAWINGRA